MGVIALYAGKGNGALTLKPLFDAAHFDAGKIFSATSICIMSFLGFDAVSTLAEEVEGGDRRLVGRAIIATLVLSAVFFVAVTWVLGNLLPGIAINTAPTDFAPIKQLQLMKFAGQTWQLFGNVMSEQAQG